MLGIGPRPAIWSVTMAPAPITYVRHSMADQVDGVHPTEWHLGDSARADVERLAPRLEVEPVLGALVSSTEPKAWETAEVIGRHWSRDPVADDRLREAARPWIGPGYRAVAHRYLRGELPDGWEHHAAVADRMAAAVDEAKERAEGAPVVVVAHGLCLAVHLGAILGAAFDRASFWSAMAFPDAWTLDPDGLLHRPLSAPAL